MSEQENPNQSRKAKRIRSPAYPAIGLREAIEKAKILYGQINRHAAPVQVISEAWGYNKEGTTGPLYAAALRRYGLLEEIVTAKGTDELKLTTTALKILLAPEENDEVLSLLKEAALKPKIFAELWHHYQGNLPNDKVMRYYLLTEKAFNPDSVDYFLKIYRDSIALANLGAADKIGGNDFALSDTGRPEQKTEETGMISQDAKVSANPTILHSQGDLAKKQGGTSPSLKEFTLPIPHGGIIIKGPFPLSASDFTTFKEAIDLFKVWLVEPSDLSKLKQTKVEEEE